MWPYAVGHLSHVCDEIPREVPYHGVGHQLAGDELLAQRDASRGADLGGPLRRRRAVIGDPRIESRRTPGPQPWGMEGRLDKAGWRQGIQLAFRHFQSVRRGETDGPGGAAELELVVS